MLDGELSAKGAVNLFMEITKMTQIQTIIITILTLMQLFSFGSFIKRASELDDYLWIEPSLILFIGLLEYLVLK